MAQPDAPAVLVLTTVPADFDWAALARLLVDRRLAACVSVLAPMRSTYRWQGAIETAEERQLLVKTSPDRLTALESALTEHHPYEVPELLVVPVERGSTAYLAWIRSETRLTP